jgi:hypothetical protein
MMRKYKYWWNCKNTFYKLNLKHVVSPESGKNVRQKLDKIFKIGGPIMQNAYMFTIV